jgi:hypothetical protein
MNRIRRPEVINSEVDYTKMSRIEDNNVTHPSGPTTKYSAVKAAGGTVRTLQALQLGASGLSTPFVTIPFGKALFLEPHSATHKLPTLQ